MRLLRTLSVLCLAIALLLAGLTYRPMQVGVVNGRQDGAGQNAAWIEHRWVGEPQSRGSLLELCTAARLHALGVLYVHVGPLDGAGRIAAGRAPDAARFVASFHAVCPGVQLLAWLGGMLPAWNGTVDLQSAAVRGNLAATAAQFVALGFDGIQYDLEPVVAGDSAFLDLLRRTRAVLHGARLAVAGPSLVFGNVSAPAHLRLPLAPWPASYYRLVAALVDEIDPLLYDTSLRSADAYVAFVAWQASSLSRLLPGTQIRLGLPAYHARGGPFDDRVENLRSACAGLRRSGADLPVAVYALWTMTATQWGDFARCSAPLR